MLLLTLMLRKARALYVVVNDNVLTKALDCNVRFAFSDVTIQGGNDFNNIAFS